ncbi:MAG: RNA ligase RtcB family protein [Hyphomicrobiaceae bacterium]
MGNSLSVGGRAPIHHYTSSKSWIEGNATLQLEQTASLKGVTAVAAMPDLHPGKYGPVGCAILADAIHPGLVGADIGCGMGLFQLDLPSRKLRVDKAADRLRILGDPWDGAPARAIAEANLPATAFDHSLGTIGGGNHFCELQAVDQIVDAQAAADAGLDPDLAVLLVHSGSRGLGYSILESVLMHGLVAFDPASESGQCYLAGHDHAVRWAKLNRLTIAQRAAAALRADQTCINDLSHNLAEKTPRGILHRKGAAPSDRGLVPVPGSRGARSYLVKPLAADIPETLASIAHGAGRKYERGSMHGRAGHKRSDRERLARNPFGGVVICEDSNLLIEEAPEAYKSIENVIADLVAFKLATVVATFKPLVTFKSTKDSQKENRAKSHDRRTASKRNQEDFR